MLKEGFYPITRFIVLAFRFV